MVSVIVPTYNYARYIGVCLDSILGQTYPDIEVIVVDDGSTDDTEKVVKSYGDPRIKYVYQTNSGACPARNHGIRVSSGEYLFFLDSDDFYQENHIEEYLKKAKCFPGCNIYGPWGAFNKVGEGYVKLYEKGNPETPDLLDHWLRDWWIASCCILWPRANLDKVGGWDESLAADQDGDIGMRALVEGVSFVFAPNAPLAHIIEHESEQASVSRTQSTVKLQSRLRVIEKLELLLKENSIYHKKYRYALAERSYMHAYKNLITSPGMSDLFFKKYRELKGFGRPPGSFLNWVFVSLLGLRRKEQLASFVNRILS